MRKLALPLLLLVAGCQQEAPPSKPSYVTEDWDRDPSTQRVIDPGRIPGLQKMATNACLCERDKGYRAKDECWSTFWAEVNEYRHGSAATACAAGSSSFIDFGEQSLAGQFDEKEIVMTEWGYGACSAEELPAKKLEYERKSAMSGC